MLPHQLHPLASSSLFLLAALPLAYADVEFLTPPPAANIPVGPITVSWKDSGRPPVIEELSQYTLNLMVGGNEINNMLPIATFESGAFFTNGSTITGTIEAGISGPVTNGFFMRITSTDDNGGFIVNYSDRFSITGLTGTIAPLYLNAAKGLNGNTNGPPRGGNVRAILSTAAQSTVSKTTSPTSILRTTTSFQTAPSTSTPTPTPPPSSGSIHMGAIVGIVVGMLALVSLIAGLILYLLRRRRQQRRRQLQQQEIMALDDKDLHGKQASVTTLSELSAEGRVMEMGDGQPPPEMDSNAVRAELEGDCVMPSPTPTTPTTPSTPPMYEATTAGIRSSPPPLTPIAPSVFEMTLESPMDYMDAFPATPTSRV